MRQHKVFLRHELLKYNSEKSTAKSSALENYISSANLSLSGCSSAEPNSVSVGRCKFQLKKLYLQTVKKVDHLPYEIADYINGLACQKFRPENENDDYLPVIKIREMNEGKSNNTERARINIPEKNIINDGDVLFAWSASLDVKIWTEGKGALNQHIFKVVSKDFPRSFYYFELLNYLKHFKMMAELRKTTMGHITIDHLKTSYISIPPKNLIEKLDKKLNILIEKILLFFM